MEGPWEKGSGRIEERVCSYLGFRKREGRFRSGGNRKEVTSFSLVYSVLDRPVHKKGLVNLVDVRTESMEAEIITKAVGPSVLFFAGAWKVWHHLHRGPDPRDPLRWAPFHGSEQLPLAIQAVRAPGRPEPKTEPLH